MVKHTIYVVLLIIVAGCNNDNKKQEVTLPDEIIKERQDIENYVPKKNISEIKVYNNQYVPYVKDELKLLVEDINIPLSYINVSLIDDMSRLFEDSKRVKFDGISSWNTSKVILLKLKLSYLCFFGKAPQLLNKFDDKQFYFYIF